MISIKILCEIISDIAPESSTLKRVGLVGSYSRGDFNEDSDIDLVFDTGDRLIDEAVLSAGLKIKSIIADQFDKEVDIINYRTIVNRKDKEHLNYYADGYRKMMEDLKWLWRRET